ncbi:putative phospholipidtranslocating P-type ATPase [Monocercomonoides exilis]|uniref:putative phospholipidtranslocating P-type ATPase n=1 Tax=Monocercomonoides exilis TaxID=2049356 RepID=UPI00355A1175|nr:putative phospholipidtranslocating P-type ATPase [Monocercomonoides exilis]|eukprot:MONOS_3758.1-p1 / transcript=MONOS_3758.1 / gene=MONOS_3758 / organism=Monocercomonoides_exilis_PA203 / gene_product=phospholipidtranslocating P-type ATPase / transcript_product=phospholipidtranslocating P-type ATPase / location=Mono_scaffold00091:107692-109414(-) / protein_length=427 / sequence_SO=supercontig / SO=protein_coding / is_pseudo=false
MCMNLLPGVNVYNPVTAVLPIIFIFSVGALKDAYEDYLRHKTDKKTNQKPVRALRNSKFETIQTQKLSVGDFVLISANDEIPADIVLITSTEENGTAYVNTMNLDGETNLKVKRAHPSILDIVGRMQFLNPESKPDEHEDNASLPSQNVKAKQVLDEESLIKQLKKLRGEITFQAPNRNLNQFAAKFVIEPSKQENCDVLLNNSQIMQYSPPSYSKEEELQSEFGEKTMQNNQNIQNIQNDKYFKSKKDVKNEKESKDSTECSITPVQLLLKGCSMKCTPNAVGLVVYTGNESKVQLNSQTRPSSLSTLDRKLNYTVGFLMAAMFCLIVGSNVAALWWNNSPGMTHPYLFLKHRNISSFFLNIIAFFVFFSYLIPISLFVSLEVTRFIQSIFLEWDTKMFDAKRGEEGRMNVRTSTLNEELGMVWML